MLLLDFAVSAHTKMVQMRNLENNIIQVENIHLISVLQSNSTHLAKLDLYVRWIWIEKELVCQKTQCMKNGLFNFYMQHYCSEVLAMSSLV